MPVKSFINLLRNEGILELNYISETIIRYCLSLSKSGRYFLRFFSEFNFFAGKKGHIKTSQPIPDASSNSDRAYYYCEKEY